MKNNFFEELKGQINGSKIGFEKESIRISNDKISFSKHPTELGSPLFNKYITTDFSEAQLELITPPEKNKVEALRFLKDLHHYVSCNIGDELIWPFSMPPSNLSESDIAIAKYGSSNKAKLKELYRVGLSNRYGRLMQAISGFHYNFSAPECLMEFIFSRYKKFYNRKSEAYFSLLKNIHEFNWIILYLTGASPIVPNLMIKDRKNILKKLSDDFYFHPFATSLRMSEYGYKNVLRDVFKVSFTSLNEYVSDIQKATSAKSNFSDLQNKENLTYLIEGPDKFIQINSNKLQIDDEYYAIARLKSSLVSSMSTTEKIKTNGVDFIEVRSLDLNPYAEIGTDMNMIYFLEILLLYCLIKGPSDLSIEDFNNFENNDSLISIMGRDPNLKLLKEGKRISPKNWGLLIIDELMPIAELLNDQSSNYTNCLDKAMEAISHPEVTLSARILDDLQAKKMNFDELGLSISEKNKAYFSKIDKSENSSWDIFEVESKASTSAREKEEQISDQSFKDFLKDNGYI